MRAPGSASSRNISSTRTAARSASGSGFPAPQGPYYTGVGYSKVGDIARKIVEEHLELCLAAGINHEGINAEVAKGQWEFQIFGKGSKRAADEMWMARYLMQRLTEKYCIDIEYHCKPLGDTDWNGSGMHANFSTTYLREVGGKEYFEQLMAAFEANCAEHIAVYGPDNHLRLTGKHETAGDRSVQLWHRRPWRIDPRAAQLRQERLAGLSRGSPPELARRPVPDRLADPEDDRLRPGPRQGRRVGGRLTPSRSSARLWPRQRRRRDDPKASGTSAPHWCLIAFVVWMLSAASGRARRGDRRPAG